MNKSIMEIPLGVIKRINQLLGLRDLDIFVEDTAFDSQYFRVLECPPILTQGKSSFLIGGSQYLKPGVDVKFEIVHDLTKEVIYTEAVFGHLEGDLRRVSIEVYSDIIPGPATLYIVGELNPDTSDVTIPNEWQGIYNVRWTKRITINAAGVNTQSIYFHKQPRINVAEIFRGYIIKPAQPILTAYLTGSGKPRQGLPPIAPTPGRSIGGNKRTTATYPERDFAEKANLAIIEEHKIERKLTGKEGHIGKQGKLLKTRSPAVNDYLITVNSTSPVSSSYVGQTFTINNPQVDDGRFTLEDHYTLPTVYTSSIMKVLNETTFVPSRVFYINDTRTSPSTLIPAPLAEQYITASYQNLPSAITSSVNYFSFADIELSDLRTFSGDVHRVKIYAKSEGSIGDFEKIYDSPIESSEILFDGSDKTMLGNMGYLQDQSRINKYWQMNEGTFGNGSSVTLDYNTTYFMDSMQISGSNRAHERELRVQLKETGSFVAGNSYTIRANLYGIKTEKVNIQEDVLLDGEFKVYTSGSAFNKATTEGSQWGVEKLSVPDFPVGVNEYDFGVVQGDFLADNTGPGVIQFKVPAGRWYVSDISVKASSDTAFNPEYVNVVAPMPKTRSRPDKVKFLVEFYDVNNNIADSVIFSDFFTFEGENVNIGGTDNILSGSMFIGNALAAGIEMAGVSSAYVRSMGYLGFSSGSGKGGNSGTGDNSGFLMWSGSVLSDSGDNYSGVGLELVGTSESYFRFRTDPSELDIRANAFFVGSETSQYISGSGGNIEISSSQFHLSGGNATMQGTVSATAGEIGGWTIESGRLTSGIDKSAITMSGADQIFQFGSGSTFNKGDLRGGIRMGKDTDGKYKFAIGTSTSYIVFDGSSVSLKSDEVDVTASLFNVDVDVFKLSANNLFISSSEGGFISAGNPRPTGIDGTNKGFWVQGNNAGDNKVKVLIGEADGNRLTFDGDNFVMSASTFFLGSSEQYISGSLGDIEISSSMFHLDPKNNKVAISGSIVATGGVIGGFTITGDALSSTNFFISGSPTAGGVDNPEYMFISSSNFNVKASGDVTASALSLTGGKVAGLTVESGVISVGEILKLKDSGQITGSAVLFKGGTVGGWTLTDTTLTGGVVTLNSAGSIEVGGLADATTTATTNSGFFADSSGNVLIKGNVSGNDYLKVSNGGSIDIKAQVFDLATSTMLLDSGTNNGKIALGSTPPTAFNSGNGFYVDGNSNLLIGSASADHIQYNATTNVFDVQVGSLELDATNIKISSTQASMSLGEGKIILSGSQGGVIKLGEDNDNLTLTEGNGIFLSGSGEFKMGDADGGIRFVNDSFSITGSDVNINVTQFNVSASGFTLSSPQASMSLGNNKEILLHATGGTNSVPIFKLDGGEISASEFRVDAQGQITASAGLIGGFELASTQINSSNDNLILKSSGQITGSSVLLDGGKIGGWTITANQLEANNIKINATSGYIEAGELTNVSDIGDTSVGFFANKDGEVLIKAGTSANKNYMQFKNGTLDINSDKVHMSGSQITLKSPDFYLGDSSNYVSGSGGNLAIYSTGATTLSGSSITLKTPDFYLGDSSNYVSGSGGNLAIYSTGDTTLSGSSVKIKTPDFYFGDSSVFLSGSGGDLAIGASNFSVDSSGNLTLGDTSNEHIYIANGSDLLFKNSSTIMAELDGTTWTLGGASGATDDSIKLSAGGGVQIYDSSTDYTSITSTGFDVVEGGTNVAHFGSISRVGDVANEHMSMSSDGMHIKDGSTTRALFTGGGATLGVTSGPHISASTTDIHIKQSSDDYLQIDSDSVDIYAGGNLQGTFAATTKIGTTADFLELDSTSIDFMRNTSTSVMNLTDTAFRLGDSSAEHIIVDTSGLTIKDSSTVRGKFTAGGATIGVTSEPHISASTSDITIYGNDTTDYLKLSSGDISMYTNSVKGVHIVDSKMSLGPAANASATLGAVIGNIHLASTGAYVYGNATNTFTAITSAGMETTLAGTKVAIFGSTTAIGGASAVTTTSTDKVVRIDTNGIKLYFDSNNYTQIDSNSLDIVLGGQTSASFGTTTTIGPTGGKHVSITSSGIALKVASTTYGTFAETVTVGNTSDAYMTLDGTNFKMYDGGGAQKVNINATRTTLGGADNATDDTIILTPGSGVKIYDSSTAYASIDSDSFDIVLGGQISASFGTTTTIGPSAGKHIKIDSNAISIKTDANTTVLSASAAGLEMSGTIQASGGTIGGATITSDKLAYSPYWAISASAATADPVSFISSSAFKVSAGGNITGSSVLFTGGKIAGYTISGDTLTATNFTLDASGKSISLGSGNTIFIADADEGIQLGHATFGSAPFSVTTAGVLKAESGTIGGWNIDSSKIYSTNLNIHSTGIIETGDFASGVKGWRLDSANNGQAEFENVTIRGTLSTAVFEKESVNAVGGQLYIANSTALTGSQHISASATTMSVVNVGGFTGSYNGIGAEIITAKKLTTTGFSTEYMLVQSASRNAPSSDSDFSGKLYVVRGYRSGSSDIDYVGENADVSHSYAPGQVFASTGTSGSGYVRINANPTDTSTPYIDIVERTGSGVYDVELKARLGDLSGLSSTRLHGTNPAHAGFGLYSQNVFLEGGINANTGSIGGIKMQSSKLYTGTGTFQNANTGFYLDSSANFSLGDNFSVDDSANVTIGDTSAEHIYIADGSDLLFKNSTTVMAELDGTTWTLGGQTGTTDDSVVLSSGGGVTLYDSSTYYAVVDSDGLKTYAGGTKMGEFGTTVYVGDQSNDHIKLSSTGLEVKDNTTVRGKFTAGGVSIGVDTGPHISASTSDIYIKQSSTDYLKIDSDSIDIYTGGALSASFAKGGVWLGPLSGPHISASRSDIYIKQSSTDYLKLDSDSLDIYTDGNNVATFAATSVIGSSTDKVTISDSGITIRENNVDTIELASGAITLNGASSNDRVVINSDGMAVYTANVLKASAYDAGFTAYGDNLTTYTSMTSAGITMVDDSVTTGTFTAGTVTLYGASSNDRVVINNTGMSVYTANVLKATALDAGFTAYGDDVNTYATVTSTGLTIFEDSTNMANFGSTVRVGEDETDKSALRVAADGSMSIGVKDGTPNFSVTAAGVVTIAGSITITGGNAATTANVTAAQLAATQAGQAAAVATEASASSDATSKANAAQAAASASVESGINTAAAAAVAAQANIDSMETQLVLTNTGMTISSSAQSPNFGLAQFGTTTTLWDGVADADTNRKLQMNASGITLWGGAAAGNDYLNLAANSIVMKANNLKKFEATDAGVFVYGLAEDDYVNVKSDGVDVYAANVKQAAFGATTTIGNTSNNEYVNIDGDGVKVYGGSSTNYTFMDADSFDVVLNGQTSASFGTTTTIGPTGGRHVAINAEDVKVKFDSNNYTQVDSNSFNIISGGHTSASFGATTTIGPTSGSHVLIDSSGVTTYFDSSNYSKMDSDSLDIILGGQTSASFGTTTTIGPTGGKHVSITSSGLSLKVGSTVYGKFAETVTIGNTSDAYIKLDSGSFEMYDGAGTQLTELNAGTLTLGGAHGSTSKTVKIASDGVTSYYDSSNYSKMDSNSFDIVLAGQTSASFGTTTTIGPTGGSHVLIDSSQIAVKRGSVTFLSASAAGLEMSGSIKASDGTIGGWTIGSSTLTGTDATLASSGNLTLGTSDNVVRLSSDDGTYRIWTGHATAGSAPFRVSKLGVLTAAGAVIDGEISITSGDLAGVDKTTISGSANDFSASLNTASASMATQVKLSSDGMTLNKLDGTTLASYGATVTLGQTGQAHQTITATDTTFYDSGGESSATERLVISNDGTIVLKDSGGVTKVSATTTGVRVTGADTGDYVDVIADAINVVAGGDTVASLGATTTVGITGNNQYVNIDGDGVKVYGGSATTFAQVDANSFNIISGGHTSASFGATTTIGPISGSHVKIDSGGVKISGSAGNFVHMQSSSFDIWSNNELSASFGVNTTIGPVAGNHVLIKGDGLSIKRGTETFLTASEYGLYTSGSINANRGIIGGFTIDSDQIAATYVTMSTGGTYGYISLGNPAPTSATQGGDAKGAFFSGRGDFCIGDFDGPRVAYDSSTQELTLSSSKFYLGSDSQYVSGSNGNIEISSSNFHLSNTGDVTMQGTITATAGAIGGFTIANNDITGSGGILVTSDRTFYGPSGGESTQRVELSQYNMQIRTAAGDPWSVTGYLASHIVFDAIVTGSFSYSQGETSTTKYRNRFRTENIELGMYDSSDAWTAGNLFIGQGGRANSSIRTALGDSNPDAIIYPDSSNGGWVIGDGLEVTSVSPGFNTTRANSSYEFSVVGSAYVSNYLVALGGIHIGGTSDPGTDNLIVDGTTQATDGILFGSDTAAANTLHDYEEGNWTPTLNVSGTATTSVGCHYTKIGSLVTCWFKLKDIQESGTQTTDLIISGLPFTPEFDCVGGTVMANAFNFSDDPDDVNNLSVWVKTDDTLRIYETKDGDAPSAWDPITWYDITNNDDLYGYFTYRTTA